MTTQLIVFSSCDIALLTDVNIVRYQVVQDLATLWFKAKALTTKPVVEDNDNMLSLQC